MVCQACSFLYLHSIKISFKLWFYIMEEEKIGECARWIAIYVYNNNIDIYIQCTLRKYSSNNELM